MVHFQDLNGLTLGIEDLDFRIEPLPDLGGGDHGFNQPLDMQRIPQDTLTFQFKALLESERANHKYERRSHMFN